MNENEMNAYEYVKDTLTELTGRECFTTAIIDGVNAIVVDISDINDDNKVSAIVYSDNPNKIEIVRFDNGWNRTYSYEEVRRDKSFSDYTNAAITLMLKTKPMDIVLGNLFLRIDK